MPTALSPPSIPLLHNCWAIRRANFDRAPYAASPEDLAKLRAGERELIAALKARDVAAYVDGTTVYRVVSDHGVERISASRYPSIYDLFDGPAPVPDDAPFPPSRVPPDLTLAECREGLDFDLSALDAEAT